MLQNTVARSIKQDTVPVQPIICIILITLSSITAAAELTVSLRNAPLQGQLIFQVYDSADLFGNFRNPTYEVAHQINDDQLYILSGVPAGKIALLVYYDENLDGQIDRNFIGIPREMLGLSNNYRPKGPPNFERAGFDLIENGNSALDIEMFRVLGERGQWGVGIGFIGKSSPYLHSRHSAYQFIPVLTFIGERLQWFGPELRYGIAGDGKARLAVSASYRIGSYQQQDSDILAGLGDRKNTLMAGLSLQYDMPAGLEFEASYQHDVLDRIGGGQANISLSRGFQFTIVRIIPEVSLNWTSSSISNHDFGIPQDSATSWRPAYDTGSTTSLGMGIGSFVELTDKWQLILNIKGELLDDEISSSPIIEHDSLINGFAALTYTF